MPTLPFNWENLWNKTPGTNVEKTLALLKHFVEISKAQSDLGWLSFFDFSPKVLHVTRVSAVECILSMQDHNQASVESILAHLKKKINKYDEYVVNERRYPHDKNEITVNSLKLIGNMLHLDFDMMSPYPRCRLGNNMLHFDFEPGTSYLSYRHERLSFNFTQKDNPDLDVQINDIWLQAIIVNRYLSHILDWTSKQDISHGGGIRYIDNLAIILEIIKQKTGIDYFLLNAEQALDKYNRINNRFDFLFAKNWQKQFLKMDNNLKDNWFSCKCRYIKQIHSNSGVDEIELWQNKNSQYVIKITLASQAEYDNLLTHNLPTPIEKLFIPGSDYPDPILQEREKNVLFRKKVPLREDKATYSVVNNEQKEIEYYSRNRPCNAIPFFSSDYIAEPLPFSCYYDIPLEHYIRQMFHPAALGNSQTKQYSLLIADFSSENRTLLIDFLGVLQTMEPDINDVLQDVWTEFESHHMALDADIIKKEIKSTLNNQLKGKYEPLWDLAKNYFETYSAGQSSKFVTQEDVHTVCSKISQNSPYYKNAQEILSFIHTNEPQEALRHILRSNNHKLAAYLLESACGYGIGTSPLNNEAHNDEKTIQALIKMNKDKTVEIAKTRGLLAQFSIHKETQDNATQTDDNDFKDDITTSQIKTLN